MQGWKELGAVCRLPLALLAAGAAAWAGFRLLCSRADWAEWWLEKVSMPYKSAASALVDPLPFSAAELLCTLIGLAALALLIGIPLAVRAGRGALACRRACALAALAVWCYVLACLFWGTQYYGQTFQQKSGLTAQPVSAQALYDTAAYFVALANQSAGAVPRGADGGFAVSAQEILQQSDGLYDGAVQQYPCLDGPQRRPKPALYSYIMSAAGFTGYLFPYFGESTLNVDAPAVFLPVTVAHELSHQRGVAREDEANFCGIEACLLSGKPVYYYSGALFGFLHTGNALYSADPDAYWQLYAALCPEAQRDLQTNNEYWSRWESPATTVAQSGYEGFMASYGETRGMASYGACVDLLVARYGGAAQADESVWAR